VLQAFSRAHNHVVREDAASVVTVNFGDGVLSP